MKTSCFLWSRAFVVFALLAVAWPASAESKSRAPNSFALSLKGGRLNLVDDTQIIDVVSKEFDDSSNIYGIEGEWRTGPGENTSFGFEVLRFNNRFKTAGTANFEDKMRTHSLLFKSKYYMGPSDYWQPYLGFGMGLVNAYDYDGPISGAAAGLGLNAVLGMQFRSDRVGFRFEYTYLHSDLEDNDGEEISASSHGFLVGMSFYFGRKPQ